MNKFKSLYLALFGLVISVISLTSVYVGSKSIFTLIVLIVDVVMALIVFISLIMAYTKRNDEGK